MKKIFFLIIAILITLITSQKEKDEEKKVPKMVCELLNRSYTSCFWYTRNKCCNKKPNCEMGKTMQKCKKIFHWYNDKQEKVRIEKELEEERKKFHSK